MANGLLSRFLTDIKPFSLGLAAVKTGSKWKYINSSGDFICRESFDEAGYFNYCMELEPAEKLAVVKVNDSILYLKDDGTVIRPRKNSNRYQFISQILLDDFGTMYASANYGLAMNGQWIIFPEMKKEDFRYNTSIGGDGLIKFRKNRKWGFLDTNGRIAIEPRFNDARNFNNGYGIINNDGKWGIINTNGEYILDPQKYDIRKIDAYGFIHITDDRQVGLLDLKGNEILPAKYGWCSSVSGDIIHVVGKDYKHGLMDKNGREILSLIYNELIYYSDNMIYLRRDKEEGYINIKGEWLWGPY